MTSSRPSKKGAFTLLEVSIVVLIFAMVGALVVPRLQSMRRGDELRKFQIDLPSLIRTAKNMSVSSSQPVTMTFSSDTNSLTLQNSEGEGIGESLRMPDEIEVMRVRVGKEDSAASDWQFRFYPDGTCDNGGIEFRLAGKTQSLVVVGQTAYSRWTAEELPESNSDEWPAGELEQRVAPGGGQ